MKNMAALVDKVMRVANNNPDGFTLNLRTMEFETKGYSVAFEATQNSFGRAGAEAAIRHALEVGHERIGGWLNEENGRYYFDSVALYTSQEVAEHVGRQEKQIAVFDLANLRTIYL